MFESYISLGWYCAVAGSLSKNWFRSFSSPFDWCYSDFNSVISQIENDFSDFLKKENLIFEKESGELIDTKYGFVFNHDIQNDFENEFDDIKEKYSRRTKAFLEASCLPTCFFRAVRNKLEIDYIAENKNYITKIIKKNNSNNEIIYLVPDNIDATKLKKLKINYFKLNIEKYSGESWEEIRNLLDDAPLLLDFMNDNYPILSKYKNLYFDKEKEIEHHYKKIISGYKNRYELAIRLIETEFSKNNLPDEIVIFGAGKIGQAFYKKIKEHCKVECFVETEPNFFEYNNVKILSLDELNKTKCKNFVITPIYNFKKIKKELKKRDQSINTISINDILI